MGYLDADGYLYLSDRTSDVIISGGVNIYPVEVDAVLLTHPAVADVATVGVPNPEWGEEVKSVVELREEFEATTDLAEELVAYCRQRLAAFKCPRSIDFTEKLPRLETGKILRRVVREKYWKGRERRI
jgi:long-chain acyl-CoA synthetase